MNDSTRPSPDRSSTRREFLGQTAAATAAAGALAGSLGLSRSAYAAGDDTLRVGLVGCGGRGTGAARQALMAHTNNKLVAMGETFKDRLDHSLKTLQRTKQAPQVQVDEDHRFVGLDAYKKVIDSSDVVLLATPPAFRPIHIKACVEAGRHIFAEKPVAVDPVGIRSVLESCEKAKEKNLSVVSGLCWRYHKGLQEMIQRIHDGAIGRIISIDATRYRGGLWTRQRRPGMTNMQWQVLNWYYFPYLSGDFNTEQFVHEMDRAAWALGDVYPESCLSTGGRATRTEKVHGSIYDHFAGRFDYENGVKFYATHRQQNNCANSFELFLLGDKGVADLQNFRITGPNAWETKEGDWDDKYRHEHEVLFQSIRGNEPINNGDYMSRSTLMALMQRESAYTGDRITWDQAMNSDLDMSPPSWSWDADVPEVPPVILPDETDFASRTGKWWA